MSLNTAERKKRSKNKYWRYWIKLARFKCILESFHRSSKYIIALLFITMCSKILYAHSKIIRVDHHFFAPFTLIDSNKRLMWRGSYCVQNLTDQESAQQCVSVCALNNNCTTINYHREKKICELLNMSKFDALGVLQYQPGWTHYETDDNARLMGPACYQLKPCKHYEVCEDTFTPKLYTCKCQDDFIGEECNNYVGPGINESVPAPSCSLLMKRYKSIPDGEYWIEGENGNGVRRNCTRRIKNVVGGCKDKSCHANATCTKSAGKYTCKCKSGYTGNGKLCAACASLFTCKKDKRQQGHNIANLRNISTRDACAENCCGNSECIGFDYFTGSNRCLLTKTRRTQVDLSRYSGAWQCELKGSKCASLFTCEKNKRQKDFNIASYSNVPARDACAKKCCGNSKSVGFDYNIISKNCYLSETRRTQVGLSKYTGNWQCEIIGLLTSYEQQKRSSFG